ncbi:hypothetical protein [Desulfosporosinus fructosivorans]
MPTQESLNHVNSGYNITATEYRFTGYGGTEGETCSFSTFYNGNTSVPILMARLADMGSRVAQVPMVNIHPSTINDLELFLSNYSRPKDLSTEPNHMTSVVAFIRQFLVGSPIMSVSGAIGREELIAMQANVEMPPDALALIKSITSRRETQKVFYFGESDFPSIWVVVDNSDVELEMVYSRLYVEFIARHPNFNCDFLVLGRDEISYFSIPEEAVMF